LYNFGLLWPHQTGSYHPVIAPTQCPCSRVWSSPLTWVLTPFFRCPPVMPC